MINKIFNLILRAGNFLSEKINIRIDLILHFSISFILCSLLMIICSGSLLAPGITILIGIGKEIYDIYKPQPTGFSGKDLFADFLGISTGYLISNIILLIF